MPRVYIPECERERVGEILRRDPGYQLDLRVNGQSIMENGFQGMGTAVLTLCARRAGDEATTILSRDLADVSELTLQSDPRGNITVLLNGLEVALIILRAAQVPAATPRHLVFIGTSDFGPLRPEVRVTGISVLFPANDGWRRFQEMTPVLGDLTELTLSHCQGLTEISSLANLVNLTSLDLGYCKSLQSVEPVAALVNLTSLSIFGCKALRDITPVASLVHLKSLYLSCEALRSAEPVAGLVHLTSLGLDSCELLQSIEPVAGLVNLKSLDLRSCKSLQSIEPVAGLANLASLNLGWCESLQSVEPVAGLVNLKSLDLSSCKSLQSIEPVAGLANLTFLSLHYCTSLKDIECVAGLVNLTTLDLGVCESLTSVAPVAGLVNLTWLSFRFWELLRNIEPVAALVNLTSLYLGGCKALEDIEPLLSLVNLNVLDLSDCRLLQSIGPLAELVNLTSLDLSGCDSLRSIEPMAGLLSLTSLNLSGCGSLQSIEPMAGLLSLTSLNLSGCGSLQSIESVATLVRLTSLDLNYCNSLRSIDPLATLVNLTSLNLAWYKMPHIEPVGALVSLTSLRLGYCKSLQNIEPVAGLVNLTSLDLGACESLQSIEPVTGLVNLTSLELSNCKSLQSIEPVTGLVNLTSLDLGACESLQSIKPVAGLVNLTSLDLGWSKRLQSVEPVASLAKIEYLSVDSCPSLKRIAAISGCGKLTRVSANGSSGLRDIDALSSLPLLRDLSFDIDPSAAIAVLAHAARKRNDKAFIEEKLEEWLAALPAAKNPDHLATRLSAALVLGEDEDWSGEAALSLVGTSRDLGLHSESWETILGNGLSAGEGWIKEIFEAAIEGIDPQHDAGTILAPWLASASRIPASLHPWALDTANRVLDPIRGEPVARPLTPAVCLFYARLGQPAQVREWLNRATVKEAPIWRDRAELALLRWEIERGALEEACKRSHDLVTDVVKDQAHEALADALAATQPESAREELVAITSSVRRAAAAARLSRVPAFTGDLRSFYQLLLALEEDPQALADLMTRITEDHPDSPFVREAARHLAPGPSGSDIATAIGAILDDNQACMAIGSRGKRVLQGLLADPKGYSSVIALGLSHVLQGQGALLAEDTPEFLAACKELLKGDES